MQGNRIWSAQKSVMRKTSIQTDFSCIKSDTIYNLQLPLCLRWLSLQMDYTWTQNCKPCGPKQQAVNLRYLPICTLYRNWTFFRFYLLWWPFNPEHENRFQSDNLHLKCCITAAKTGSKCITSHRYDKHRNWKELKEKRRSSSIILFFAFHVHIQQDQWKNVKHIILNQCCH